MSIFFHILFLLYLLLWFCDFTIKNLQDFIKIYRALIKDIFLRFCVSSVDQVAAYQVCSHPGSVCLVDHVLHGVCPDVMTLGSQRRTVAYYTRGE